MDPHHIEGRHGDKMLVFCWLHRQCHNWAHMNVARARALGLIVYSYDIERKAHDELRKLENHQGTLVDSRPPDPDAHSGGVQEGQSLLPDSSGEDTILPIV